MCRRYRHHLRVIALRDRRLVRVQIDLAQGLRAGASPMTFFSVEVRCPVHAADVAAAIVHIAADRRITGPLHVAGPEPVSRVDYAAALAHHAGLGHIPLPTTTITESGMTRPANVVLDSSLGASIDIECRSLREALSASRAREPGFEDY